MVTLGKWLYGLTSWIFYENHYYVFAKFTSLHVLSKLLMHWKFYDHYKTQLTSKWYKEHKWSIILKHLVHCQTNHNSHYVIDCYCTKLSLDQIDITTVFSMGTTRKMCLWLNLLNLLMKMAYHLFANFTSLSTSQTSFLCMVSTPKLFYSSIGFCRLNNRFLSFFSWINSTILYEF